MPSSPQSKWFPEFEQKLPSLQGKTVAITGCTSGIGLVAAKTCARKGADAVILLNRPSERATKAEQEVKAIAGDNTKVVSIPCDLQDFASVREAAASISTQFLALDVLCNNAGVALLPDKATKDGHDVHMQTNHLSHFLLVKELLPLLQKAAELRGEARIVHQTSESRKTAGSVFGGGLEAIYFEERGGNLGGNSPGWFGAMSQRYSQSKLANSVFTMALQRKLALTHVKAVAAAPGVSSTGMLGHALDGSIHGCMGRMVNVVADKLAQSVEDGAMPLLSACFDRSTESGDFWNPSKMGGVYGPPKKIKADKKTNSSKNAEILWKKSEEAVGKFDI